jgi:CRISPR-associated exonuclease Cas4
MSYPESELLPLSALQHLIFCERQCALIHIERIWSENRLTMEGRILHDKVDDGETESRGNLIIARTVKLRSLRLGLSGQADVVEFHRMKEDHQIVSSDFSRIMGTGLPDKPGFWMPFPVEYKRGKPKIDDCDMVQLCAQAICLEEMLGIDIPAPA